MKSKGQYLLMNPAEFADWLVHHEFDRTISRIQNHHTWKPSYQQFKGGNHFDLLDGMYNHHVHANGWQNIGQNLTTFPDGMIAVCRPFESAPACIYGANKGAICIEHLGDFDSGRDAMTPAHAECIVRTNALLCREFGLTPGTDTIVYHHWYDLGTGKRNDGSGNNKSCPGTAFFGGNKVNDCLLHFIPLVMADMNVLAGGAGGGGALAAALRKGRVASPDGVLSIRSGPARDKKKLGELKNGEVIDVFEVDGKWCRIDARLSRWVHGGYLVSEEVDAPAPAMPVAIPAGNPMFSFDLPEPSSGDLGDPLSLWGTYYYGQAAAAFPGGIPLRNKMDQVVGPPVSQRDWCLGAMEGTIVVTHPDGTTETLNYEGTGDTAETSCKVFFPNLNPAILAGTERVRWRKAKGPFGDGAGGYILVPYRTLAVDKKVIPLGTALFIGQARGIEIRLPDGSLTKHDGYFFAADVGGAIKQNHVDFFLGMTSRNPFPFVKSKPQAIFNAALVTNESIIGRLRKMHQA